MILTGTQLSSTTEKALCQKTTSTCGHTRKWASTHTHRCADASLTHLRFTHPALVHLNSSSVSLRSCGLFLLCFGHLRYKAAYPKGLTYVITHDTGVCVCVRIYSEGAGTPCISMMVLHQLGQRSHYSSLLMSTGVQASEVWAHILRWEVLFFLHIY